MPRERASKKAHIEKFRTRHGKTIWYFRVGKGARVRLPDDPASPGFERAYNEALAAHLAGILQQPRARTLAWLIEQYRASPQYAALAKETRKQFRYQLDRMRAKAGKAPLAEITQESIVRGRDDRRGTPSDANKYLRASKRLYAFAVEHGWMRENPAAGVGKVPLPNRQTGFLPWEEEDLARFEARWPSANAGKERCSDVDPLSCRASGCARPRRSAEAGTDGSGVHETAPAPHRPGLSPG